MNTLIVLLLLSVVLSKHLITIREDDILRRNSPFLQSKINPNFNFPEVNEIVGSGYKKMKGYICTVSKVDLEKKRNEFWCKFYGN